MALMLSFLARLDVVKNFGGTEYFNPMYAYKMISDMESEWIHYDRKLRAKKA